jgi:hypothetical protein
VKFQPLVQSQISLAFGSFPSQFLLNSSLKKQLVFGNLDSPSSSRSSKASRSQRDCVQNDLPVITTIPSAGVTGTSSNSNSLDRPPTCSKCLVLGHVHSACTSSVRCLRCFKLGHLRRQCRVKLSPAIS